MAHSGQAVWLFRAFCPRLGTRRPNVKPIFMCCLLFLLMVIDVCKMRSGSFKVHLHFAPYLVLFGEEGMEIWHLSLTGGALSHDTLLCYCISICAINLCRGIMWNVLVLQMTYASRATKIYGCMCNVACSFRKQILSCYVQKHDITWTASHMCFNAGLICSSEWILAIWRNSDDCLRSMPTRQPSSESRGCNELTHTLWWTEHFNLKKHTKQPANWDRFFQGRVQEQNPTYTRPNVEGIVYE